MTLILSGTNGLSDVDGSAATPAIRGTDANTGIFFGADIIGFAEGGAEVARFNADAQFVAAAGTASLPVITTTGDVNTGIFFPAADTIAFAEGGAEVARFNADAQFVAAAGTALLPVITTTGDVNTGMWFPAADTIAFAEGGVESMRLDSSANLQFNSGYGSVATAYGCRAWVNFNGTGTPAIRASGNVTSITDNGTGDYTVNFTTAMPDANYVINVTGGFVTNDSRVAYSNANNNTASGARANFVSLLGSGTDPVHAMCAIFR
jgi:hypothetical protein